MPTNFPQSDHTSAEAEKSALQTSQPRGTVQTRIPNNAIITDVRRVLEDNQEIASITNRQESFYPRRIKTALHNRFGWEVDTDTVRAAVNELGPDVVEACARSHGH